MSIPHTMAFKISLVGDPRVGKTSLRRMYLGEGFSSSYLPTLGVDFASCPMTFSLNDQLHKVNTQIWDLGGQKHFSSVRNRFLSGTHIILIVFDLTNQKSFENIWEWLTECFESVDSKNVGVIIIGNKLDLEVQRVVAPSWFEDEVEKIESKYNTRFVKHLETSAMTGYNVIKAFEDAVVEMINERS